MTRLGSKSIYIGVGDILLPTFFVVVDRMFVTIFEVPDSHSWFVLDMYKTKMTDALSHKFYVNFCFF